MFWGSWGLNAVNALRSITGSILAVSYGNLALKALESKDFRRISGWAIRDPTEID